MPANPNFKTVEISPSEGVLDMRSLSGSTEHGTYRWRQNFVMTDDKRMCRAKGFRRFMDDRDRNNWDLHDQLFSYDKQHITMLFEAETTTRFSKLFAGTQNRIYALNNSTGNWKVISDELGGAPQDGCSELRFTAAQVKETMVFTNGEDVPVSHVIDQPAMEPNSQSVKAMEDLVELNISRVKVLIAFHNLMLFMNVEEDGQVYANRIYWSDYNNPTSIVPSTSSVSGYFDLDTEDTILAASKIANSVYIYTTKGIWECIVVGGTEVLSFSKRWTPDESGERCLAFPGTLVSTGANHFYMGRDAIYQYNPFLPEPLLVDWIHEGAKHMFDTLDKTRCKPHIGGYKGDVSELWFSWVKPGHNCSTECYVVNMGSKFCSYVDYGASAFLHHEPDEQFSIRDFIKQYCICSAAELDTYGIDFDDELEGNYQCRDEKFTNCATAPASWYSQTSLTEDGVEMEDDTGDPDADSLYTLLGTVTVASICRGEYDADQCQADRRFIFASSYDKAVKEQDGESLSREYVTNKNKCGEYVREGYKSILRSNAIDLGARDDDKVLGRFVIDGMTALETLPAQVKLRIGMSATPQDPNLAAGKCAILWQEQDIRQLECLDEITAEEHQQGGTRPTNELEWTVWLIARYFYIEITIENSDTPKPDTGGSVCFSRFAFDVSLDKRALP